MSERTCKHCGRPESEHCLFEPDERPEGCVCDAGTWSEIAPICSKYKGNGYTYCETCEHDKGCHRG